MTDCWKVVQTSAAAHLRGPSYNWASFCLLLVVASLDSVALGRFSCLESWCSAQNEVNASPAGSVLPRPGLAASRWPGAEGSCRHLFSHVSQRAVPVRGLVSWCEDPACSWGTQSPGDLAGPPPQDALVLTSCGAALCWLLRRPLVLRGRNSLHPHMHFPREQSAMRTCGFCLLNHGNISHALTCFSHHLHIFNLALLSMLLLSSLLSWKCD